MVDIDLETVINFCDKFEKEYLEILHQKRTKIKGCCIKCNRNS